MIFNLCVVNNDSHAKNLSVLQAGDGRYRLATFYDLMAALPAALDQAQASLQAQVGPGTGRTLIARLDDWIRTNVRRHAKRWE